MPTYEIDVDAAAFRDMLARYTEDIELPARVTLRRGARVAIAAAPAEIQVKGNFSAAFPLKSLGIKLDDEVDNADGLVLDCPDLLDGHSLARVRSLRLRNGGNDFTGTLLKDLAYARLVAGSDLAVVPYYGEPAAAFVNGEFYGLLNARSEGNANGLSRLLGVRKRDLDLAELDDAPRFGVKEGDGEVFARLERALRDGDRAAAMRLVDEESFTDFLLTGALFAVWDWPYKNVRLYAVRGGALRFFAFDFDVASERHVERPLLTHIRDRPDNLITDLFELAYADPGFRDRFWARRDALVDGGALAPRRLRGHFEALAERYAPVIDHQTAAYGHPVSRAAWYLRMERHVEQYEHRYAVFAREKRAD